jgi:serine/threonine protein kinase
MYVLTVAFLLSISSILLVWMLRKKLKQSHTGCLESQPDDEKYERISYLALSRGTNGFSEDNLLGSGRYGVVYKCIFDNEEITLAVKVFNLCQSGSSKSFEVECEAMRRIRHRRLIKIITCCSSFDLQGQEFKALVFEFMPNGSLDVWLHPKFHDFTISSTLRLTQRLDIAADIIAAVEYLHNSCQPPVIHCDLKPSNILLAEDMSARVGDFGISKFLPENASKKMQNSQNTIGIRGSIGYVAPGDSKFYTGPLVYCIASHTTC